MKVLTLLCFLAVSLFSNGHNNNFYAGDAYFASYWKVGSFEKKPEKLQLDYYRLTLATMDCGNQGAERLYVQNISEKYRNNLLKVDQLLKKTFKGNPRLLIYNADYDFKKWGVAFKYNEDWVKEQVGDGDVKHAKYDQLGEPNRMIKDWKGAPFVKKLKGSIHDSKKEWPEEFLDKGVEDGVENEVEEGGDPLVYVNIPNFYLKGEGGNYAFVFILSNTIDRMMEDSYAELRASAIYNRGESEEVRQKKAKELRATKKKPIDLLKFIVVTEKIRQFEQQKDRTWKITEIK